MRFKGVLRLLQRGFSLIEILVTTAVLAVLLAVALPSYTSFLAQKNLKNVTEDLYNFIKTGQSQALMRHKSIYISFNMNKELDDLNSQQWTKPQLLLNRPDRILWYPSLQPMNTAEDLSNKRTCLHLGKKARLFVKSNWSDKSEYSSEYFIEFEK